MKSFLTTAFLTLTTLAAQAATLTPLRPAGPTSGAYRWQCAATGFSETGIQGACIERYYSPVRYAQPTVVGTWSVTWDTSGNPTLSTTATAWPGCFGTQSVVYVNQTPYYYITADSTGRELVENYCQSYLVAP